MEKYYGYWDKNCNWGYRRNRLIHKRDYFFNWDDICCLRFVETTNEKNENERLESDWMDERERE